VLCKVVEVVRAVTYDTRGVVNNMTQKAQRLPPLVTLLSELARDARNCNFLVFLHTLTLCLENPQTNSQASRVICAVPQLLVVEVATVPLVALCSHAQGTVMLALHAANIA
jgi:hypothetical protein